MNKTKGGKNYEEMVADYGKLPGGFNALDTIIVTIILMALGSIGIFFPFLLAAILKSAQGSSTVALTTTAGIVAPLLGTMGLDTPVLASLTVMAIGAGAMTVSHANDSYFWVVTNFGEMTPDQGYKTQTVLTLVLGISSIIGIFLMSLIFG